MKGRPKRDLTGKQVKYEWPLVGLLLTFESLEAHNQKL